MADVDKTRRKEAESLSSIQSRVDSICQASLDKENLIETYFTTQEQVTDFLSSNPDIWKLFQEESYQSFIRACEQELADSIIIHTGLIYLLSGGEMDKDIVLEVLITEYGDKDDMNNTDFLLGRLDLLSEQNEGLYAEKVEALRNKYDEVLHPKTFGELTHGRWISINSFPALNQHPNYYNKLRSEFGFPDFIIDINSLEINNGAMFIKAPTFSCNVRKVGSKKNIWNYTPDWNQALLFSQELLTNGREQSINLLFASEKIHNPNTEMAVRGFEGNREFEANMKASIWSSRNANFGQKVAASALTSVTAAILDGIFESMTVGSIQVESYDMQFHATSYQTMDAIISYENVKARTNGITTHSDWVKSHANRFVKWEENDSVVFITPEGKPTFAGGTINVDSPLLDEYRQVRRKYNFGRPQFLIPTIAAIGVGTYCYVDGLIMAINGLDEDAKWTKKSTKGLLLAVVAAPIITGGVCGYIADLIQRKRREVYKDINNRSMEKMKQKALNVSLYPELDPYDESVGMNVKINF